MKLQLPIKNPVISQIFGVNYDCYKAWGLSGHNGLDLCSYWGDKIYASEDGQVVYIDDDPYGLGRNVRIVGKYYIIYAHMSQVNVNMGDMVEAGQVIGLEGNTGNVRSIWDGKPFDPDRPFYIGTHLHYGVYTIGKPVEHSYQVHFSKVNKTINILNYDNGYHGAIDPYPLLFSSSVENDMYNVIRVLDTEDQYIVVDGTDVYRIPDIETWKFLRDIGAIEDSGPDVISLTEYLKYKNKGLMPSKKLTDVLEPIVKDIYLQE